MSARSTHIMQKLGSVGTTMGKGILGCPERWRCPVPADSQGQAGGALSTDGAVVVPAHRREWDQMTFKGHLQLTPFYDG